MPSRSNPRRIGLIRNHDRNARIRNPPGINAVRNSNEIRPAPGKKYAQRFHGSFQLSASAASEPIIIEEEDAANSLRATRRNYGGKDRKPKAETDG
jgi:hypothetical protein